MKKLFVGLSLLATGAAALTIAPVLVSGYFFMDTLNTQFSENAGEGGNWSQIQDTCIGCHGFRGQSKNAQYASLAGQDASYLAAQLSSFAEGRHRHSPQMSSMALRLKKEQVKHLVDYFSRQRPEQVEAPKNDPLLAQQGQSLVERLSCTGCHAPNLAGGMTGPRIGGMGAAYLNDQLMAFKEGRRTDPARGMDVVAGGLSAEEIRAISHYVATLDPKR